MAAQKLSPKMNKTKPKKLSPGIVSA